MISAATPLFQQIPSATLHPCRKAGSTAGSQMARILRHQHKRNTCPISTSCPSTLSIPVRTAPYSTGSTIKKLISTDKLRPLTHTSAKMIKLATGVAFTSCITGASSSSTAVQRQAAAASRVLHTAPSPNPSRMRPALNAARCHNSGAGSSRTSSANAWPGVGSSTGCPTAMAVSCHTPSQNPAATRSPRRRFCFAFFIIAQLPFHPCSGIIITYHLTEYNFSCHASLT